MKMVFEVLNIVYVYIYIYILKKNFFFFLEVKEKGNVSDVNTHTATMAAHVFQV